MSPQLFYGYLTMDENFYAAPEADLTTPQYAAVEALAGLNYKQLKKLYYRSCNIRTINFLIFIGALYIGLMWYSSVFLSPFNAIIIALFILQVSTFIGLFRRASWGRALGIICSIFMLVNPPLGTMLGLAGLFAFFGAPQLFGEERITHAELYKEFKHRKRNKFFN